MSADYRPGDAIVDDRQSDGQDAAIARFGTSSDPLPVELPARVAGHARCGDVDRYNNGERYQRAVVQELFRSQYPAAAGKTVWQRVAWGAPSKVSAAARQTA